MGKLLGICGAAGAGKDTAAQALVSTGWKREAFATAMRKAILALDPIVFVDDDCYEYRLAKIVEVEGWDEAKRRYPEVRRLLQKFGTEAGRDIHGTDCWVNLVLGQFDPDGPDNIAITDCRFPNEAEAILALGGRVIRIVRPGLKTIAGGHSSENGLPDDMVGHTIYNRDTPEYLHAAVLHAVGGLFG